MRNARADNAFVALILIGCRDFKKFRLANEILRIPLFSWSYCSNNFPYHSFSFISVKDFFLIKWICTIWSYVLIITIITWLFTGIIIVSRSARVQMVLLGPQTNNKYALQKSWDCPVLSHIFSFYREIIDVDLSSHQYCWSPVQFDNSAITQAWLPEVYRRSEPSTPWWRPARLNIIEYTRHKVFLWTRCPL